MRVKKHQKAVFAEDMDRLALAEHVLKMGHGIDCDNATILTSCQYMGHCLLLESWYVQSEQSFLNREQATAVLYKTLMVNH